MSPVTIIPPCPPHDWSHAPTVGYFSCGKCRKRVDHGDAEYAGLIAALAASPPKVENVREELRDAFMQVQRAKRGDGPIAMEPIWRIINAVPSALALLDDMDGFERDLAAEALARRYAAHCNQLRATARFHAAAAQATADRLKRLRD